MQSFLPMGFRYKEKHLCIFVWLFILKGHRNISLNLTPFFSLVPILVAVSFVIGRKFDTVALKGDSVV